MDRSAEIKYGKSDFLKHEYTDKHGQEISEIRSAVFEREAAIDLVAEGSGFASEYNKQETGYYELANRVRELKTQHGVHEPTYHLET